MPYERRTTGPDHTEAGESYIDQVKISDICATFESQRARLPPRHLRSDLPGARLARGLDPDGLQISVGEERRVPTDGRIP